MTTSASNLAEAGFLDQTRALACIHCGLCLSACPTYLETGNENDSPRGRIYQMRAVSAGRLPLEPGTVRHFDLCLGCLACEVACPSGVQYGALLKETREFVEARHSRGFMDTLLRRVIVERLLPNRNAMRLLLAPAAFVKRSGLDHWLPTSLRRFTALIPRRLDARQSLPMFSGTDVRPRLGTVAFVTGCVMDVMFNRTHRNSIHLLNAAGYDVVTPVNQTCCGALHAHSGRLNLARDNARTNVGAFTLPDVDRIVINAAGCGSTLKEYGHLLAADAEWNDRARTFAGKVTDLTEALVAAPGFMRDLEEGGLRTGVRLPVTYHDACHLAHAQRVTSPPRQLLSAAFGSDFVEMPESDVCCGSAGSYNLTEPEMAARLQERKLSNLISTGARTVVTTNPGCILQIFAGAERRGIDCRVEHIADVLAAVLGPDEK